MVLYVLLGLIVLSLIFWGIKRLMNRQKFRIHSEKGIQKTEYITIGAIEQYIQIRGQDISNPLIIVLHGGPGNNMAYYSYLWQADLEKDYTIVHWDQRGCGNTYYRNKKAERPCVDLLLSDLDELVDYACAKFDKEKVIIMGHSWGTFLGGVYAARHPQKVSAYVGIGQFSDVWQSEQCAAEEAIRLANAAGKTEDGKKMKEQFQLVRASSKINMKEFIKLRQLTGKYLTQGENTPFSVRVFSPYVTLNDLKWFFMPLFSFDKFIDIQHKIYDTLYSEGRLSGYAYSRFEVPVVIISGDCDWITPFMMAQHYFDNISAPKKEFVLIEKGGHIPFMPGEFTKRLQKALSDALV